MSEALRALGANSRLCPTRLLAPSPESPVVVVDSYSNRPDALGLDGRAVVAIDDLERDLDVEVVVDPCPGARPAEHPSARRVLAGAQFAPLDPGLVRLPRRSLLAGIQRVLVATGGADRSGRGYAIAEGIAARCAGIACVRLAVGPGTIVLDAPGVEIVRCAGGLGPELAQADIVVTAGGVTLLEALSLGRPTVVLALYSNQARQARRAVELGVAIGADDIDDISAAVDRLSRSVECRTSLSERASEIVDGRGAFRVAEAVLAVA